MKKLIFIAIIIITMPCLSFAADTKASALSAPGGGPARTDKVYIVDDPGGTPASTADTIANILGLVVDGDIPTTLTLETISGTPVITNGQRIGTDDTDHLIDEASNGAGSATLYIGNESILASGDIGVSVQGYNANTTTLGATIGAAEVDADVATQAELDAVAALVDTDDEIIAIINASPSTQIGVPAGGTGAGTHTDGSLLVGAGTGALEALAVGLTTQVLVGGGAGTNPAWGTDLPTAVTIGSAYIYRAGGTDVPDADVADDITASNYAPLAGATFTDTVITDASDATASGLRLPHGAAPSAPTNGDLWTTTSGLYARINGSTVGPFVEAAGSTAYNSIGDPTGAGSISFDDGETATYDGANDTETFFTISLNAADLTGDTTALLITAVDNDDANYIPFLIQDDQDGTPDDLFKVDSTGLVTAAGGFAAGASDDPTITFDPSTASESEWWLGVNHDSVGDDNDPWELRQNATPGSSVRVSVGTSGVLAVLGGLDAIGAVDMDYGSADVTDHTFTTDGTGDGEIVLPNDSIGPSEIDSTTGAYDFGSVTSFELPNSTSDMTIGTEGQVGLESTDDQLVFHGGSAGEIQGEAAKSLLEHIAVAFDPSYWYDQESTYRVVPLFRVGDDFPEGFTMTEWRVVYVGGDPTTELDADIICDTTPDYNPAAGATVMDVIDTTAGASNADTGFDSGSCANGSVVYVRFGADPTDANVAIALDIWGYAEAD